MIYIYIYGVTFTINIPQMLAYIPYIDPMGLGMLLYNKSCFFFSPNERIMIFSMKFEQYCGLD